MFVSPRRSARVLGAVALLALLAALTFSLSRSAWIGTGAALLLMVLTMREARRLLAILFVPLALIGYLIFSSGTAPPEVKVVGERVQAIGTRSPYDQRSQIYNEALREIREDPVTGVGPGGFIVASRRAGTETSTVAADHAHNLLLNYGAESGLPAVGLVLAFVFALGAAVYRGSRAVAKIDPRHRGLILSIGAALFAIFVAGILRLHAGQSGDSHHRLDADRRPAGRRARGRPSFAPRAAASVNDRAPAVNASVPVTFVSSHAQLGGAERYLETLTDRLEPELAVERGLPRGGAGRRALSRERAWRPRCCPPAGGVSPRHGPR